MKNLLIILLIIKEALLAQYSDFKRISILDSTRNHPQSTFIVEGEGSSENVYLFYTQEMESGIFLTTNSNRSDSWSIPQKVSNIGNVFSLAAIRLTSSKLLLGYVTQGAIYLHISSNNGLDWTQLPQLNFANISKLKLLRLKDNQIGLIFLTMLPSGNNAYIIKSSDEGQSWSNHSLLLGNISAADLVLTNSGEYLLFYTDPNAINLKLKRSTDLISWTSESHILNSEGWTISKIKVANDNSDKLLLTYSQSYQSNNSSYYYSDIFYITSEDGGNLWSNLYQLTTFKGNDFNQEVSALNNDFAVSFHSDRLNGYNQIYFGYLSQNRDLNPPPYIFYSYLFPEPTSGIFPNTIRVIAEGSSPIVKATAYLKRNNESYKSVNLFDNGLNNDSLPNDNIFGGTIPFNLDEGDNVYYYAIAEDQNGKKFKSIENRIYIPLRLQNNAKHLNNNWLFPISRNGNIGERSIPIYDYGVWYDSFLVIYSAGFLLSGYTDSFLRVRGLFESRKLYDFVPGVFDVFPSEYHPSVNLYVINSSDQPFGQSWQTYRLAVQNGAPFYDGDQNGIYNPVDKNGNGQWDPDEDAPEMIGDITTWCVISDSRITSQRWEQMGIEVQVSTFSFNKNSAYGDQIFIRYRIINRGKMSDVLDSVIFSFYVDPDIENYQNDFLGCDTTLNLGYAYSGFDKNVSNPPSVGVALIQGPPVYIPDETFIDKDNDGKFNPQIDVPLDTAISKYGGNIPSIIFPGAKNQAITSFFKKLTFSGNPEPTTDDGYRLWQNSIHHDGQMTDPCNDPFSMVVGNVNCSDVNRKFLFSGDPYNRVGWINTIPDNDATFLLSTGPFRLEKDVPIDIWGVYVGGRGVDSLHSVEILKENTRKALDFYKNLPVVFEKPKLPTEFVLYQNYPNPFNSGTTIKWKMPQDGKVTIKIYDILGRHIETVSDKFYEVGEHSIKFNPGDLLASGVYFYQIKIDNSSTGSGPIYFETKKMLLIK